ncbi:UNVERIFIED_CONTAM: hypothetical protein Sradi_4357700 [Sesamum radiatum]|uniref:MULE transposase domain-containing protein n=1 Tax=Sesamum radiatum TaxID=300843 RepID=A0AAW2NRS2_SESRA
MFVRLEDEVEVNIYIHREIWENEEQGRQEESNTSGENFEDTDSEYEYKMSEKTEEKSIENEEDDWGFKGDDEGIENMKSTWLSKKYMHKFKTDPKRGIKGFKADAIEKIRCNITKNQVVRAKRLALLMLEGSAIEQYALLWDYANEIKRSNPGSTVILGTEQEGGQNMFDRFYVCLQALKLNYLNGCRPVICVDGCHLNGAYGGVLLSVVSIDPNNNFFPICYAVVMKENKDTWD